MPNPPTPEGHSLTRNSTPGDERSPIPQKASTYLLISLIFAGPTCFLTFFSLFGTLVSHDGWPTCSPTNPNRVICGVPLVPPVLSFLTFVLDIVVLYKLRRWAKSRGASPGIRAPVEGGDLNETTPLLGVVGHGESGGSPQDTQVPPPIPRSLVAWTWLFATLWAILSFHFLINISITIAPGSPWNPLIAWEWCLLLPPHILQVWMLSIAALELARLRSEGVQPVEVKRLHDHRPSLATKTQGILIVSLVLLSLSLILAEAHLIFLRLFVVTFIFDVTILFAMEIQSIRRLSTSTPTPSHHHTVSDPETEPIVSEPPRRTFFALLCACTSMLALLWSAWSILTLIAATFSLLRDVLPDWDIVRLPVPERGWSAWVWLEAVVDLWQGWTLGRAAVYSGKAVLGRA